MSDPWWSPRPSNYGGRFRLAGIALVVGLIAVMIGLSTGNEFAQTVFVSAGVGLVIGGAAVVLSAARSRARARTAEGKE